MQRGDTGLDIYEHGFGTIDHILSFDYVNQPSVAGVVGIMHAVQFVEYIYHQEVDGNDAAKGEGQMRSGRYL